jgi:hypothetical protein
MSFPDPGQNLHQGARGRGHDGSFLIVDRASRVNFVIGVRSRTGEVLSIYLVACDIEKVVDFLTRKGD